jgi:arylsulfatase A-like enzyme
MKNLLVTLALTLTLSNCLSLNKLIAQETQNKPNILYLYVDDMGWGTIGANGQKFVKTPNLDKLAAQGVNFTRAYGCTVCSPARSSQQTGFHQGYTFADRNDPNNAKKAIRSDDQTMGDVLSKAGYVTGYWGKWGYGGSKDMNSPTIENVQTLPNSHGYQHVVAELHHVRAHTFFQPTLWTGSSAKAALQLKPNSMKKFQNNKKYSNYPAFQNHPNYPKVAYCDDVYAFSCLDFVRNQALHYNRTGQPFFGLFASQIPHAPFQEIIKLPNWDQDYKGQNQFTKLSKEAQQWTTMVTRIDAHIGNLLDALEDPNGDGDKSDSVLKNTLVVFQSDNGGPRNKYKTLKPNGHLSGNKGSIMEGGIRVPMIVSWPAQINSKSQFKAGSNSSFVVDVTDLLPTFCDLAGMKIPLGISGVSLAPKLTGKGLQRQREYLIHEAGNEASIIRGKYKLRRNRSGQVIKKKKKNKSTIYLYDLNADPSERKNIASKHPSMVKELNALLTAERVDEPAGFANTYHNWLGATGSSLSDAANWSDYVYQNKGVTYLTDKGAPKSSWTARMASGAKAVSDKNVDFLGLEIGGDTRKQTLTVNKGVTLTGHNEVRVSQNGCLILNGGNVASRRWLDVNKGGRLKGHGRVKASLHTQGVLELSLEGLQINKLAVLDGQLMVSALENAKLPHTMTILKAQSISGRFKNSTIKIADKIYKIQYTKTTVELTNAQ